MGLRQEQEKRLRREVTDIVTSHLFKLNDELRVKSIRTVENPVNTEDIVNDIMGAVNQEDNYRVQDFQAETDALRKKMQNEHYVEVTELRHLLDESKAKVAKLQKEITTDDTKKLLEQKLAREKEKVRTLKKLVSLSLEDM